MVEIDHLSYSSISTYLSCSAYWRFKYIEKLPAPPTPELIFGSAFHNTIETYIQNGHSGELTTIWREKWAQQVKQAEIAWDTTTPETLCNDGIRMLEHQDIQQGILSIRGREIERQVELRVPGVPVPVIGYVDIITEDGVPGDFKTSSRAWSAEKALSEIQPLFYLAALNQAGHNLNEWRFRHYIFVKTKTPQFQILEHTHNPGQILWLFGMIRNVWQAIEAGIFVENPTGWRCSPSYCEFWSKCKGKYG